MSGNLKLTAGFLDDWFVLDGGGNWASVEGNSAEWGEVAGVLEASESGIQHKRLACWKIEDGRSWEFYSPRNRSGVADHIVMPAGDALALAAHIRKVLAAYASPGAS